MPNFGKESNENLNTAHPDLQRLFREVVKHFDCKVLCGHRSLEDSAKAYAEGKSQVPPGKSKHNAMPSLAVDVAPYPVDWNDRERFHLFAGVVIGIASQMGIGIRWGGDWDRDTEVKDNKFDDLPHFELI